MKETFKQWGKRVDRIVTNKIGLGIDDMPDVVILHDLFDDGFTPTKAAALMLHVWIDQGDVPRKLIN